MARPLTEPPPIRLRAYYRNAGALLRELSRALNRGRTLLRAESGLPVGTRLALVMVTDSLRAPIEVSGTVTTWRRRGTRHEMAVRYDFDPAPFRARLAQALAELKRETRPPRGVARVPLALPGGGVGLARKLRAVLAKMRRAQPGVRDAGHRDRYLHSAGNRHGRRLRVPVAARKGAGCGEVGLDIPFR